MTGLAADGGGGALSATPSPAPSPAGAASAATSSTGLITFTPVPQPARKQLEHVLMPQRLPRRVLVAFLDEDGPEPFWAAYLEPQDIEVVMEPMAPEDAHMDLRLSLVKKFEQ